jgi:hypothetical protein
LLEWEIVVPTLVDVNAAADSLTDAGYELVREGNTVSVRDPWGTRLRLIAHEAS